jgi:organic hydroperoxide reductase OsmC/OhrA
MSDGVREHEYRVKLDWSGAVHGPSKTYASYSREHSLTFEGKPPLVASSDPFFRGDATRFNPEELLLAALSSCHMLAYLAVCAREGIAVVGYEDDASAVLSERGGAGRFISATLRPRVTIDDERVERAKLLHDWAREDCFIAASVNFRVEHEPVVVRKGE